MKTNRRSFIRLSALTGGTAVLSWPVANFARDFLKDTGNLAKRTATYCEVCFWKCAGWVYTNRDGHIQKVVGHADDPHCNGRLCPRGTGGVGMYYDDDRLREPLLRVNKNGQDVFERVSWSEALDFIALRLKEIAEKHGPESVALFTHGSGGKFWGDLLKAYGSNNIAAPSYAQCRGPREVAWIATFGEGLDSPEPTDIRDTKCLVLIGSHLGENMHNGQVQEMSDAIDKDAVIITVDPRYSTAASKSKFWLPIKPATDIALLLAWIHELIYKNWYDKEYIDQYAYGFEELKAHVSSFTPEWAYGITTIEPDTIRKTAKAMHDASPAVIVHPGRHVTWYGDDTQRLRCVAILNALLGSWGRRGGFFMGEELELPSYPHPEYPKPSHSWRDAFPGQFALADLALANGICDATIPAASRDFTFKGWIVNGTNLIKTLPDQRNTIQAIQHLDLLVVIDTMPMEITGYADVILPECTYLERYDTVRTSKHREPTLALRMPAASPMYNSKPGWWMVKELSRKMGLESYFAWKDIEEMLDWQLKQVGSSLEEMQRIGVKKFPRTNPQLFFGSGSPQNFATNTGKIELYATSFAAAGFDPLPVYTPHPEPPSGFYRLNYGRAPMHTFSRTANNPNLVDLMDENTLWVNPKIAALEGIKNDQYIWLENQDGVTSSFPIKVRVTERMRHDSVFMVHGFGHSNRKLTRTYGRGASDAELITNVMTDPIMGGTGMRGNFVKFRPEKPSKGGEA